MLPEHPAIGGASATVNQPPVAAVTQRPGVIPLRVTEQDMNWMSSQPAAQPASPGESRRTTVPVAMLTEVQATIIRNARSGGSADERKQVKREVFSVVKAKFGLPSAEKLKAVTDKASQSYLIVHDQAGMAFEIGPNGRWTGRKYSDAQLFGGSGQQQGGLNPMAAWPFPNQPHAAREVRLGWFRLDESEVGSTLALTNTGDNPQEFSDLDYEFVTTDGGPSENPPEPHMMLAGRDDLCVDTDGRLWRKQAVE